MSALEITYLIVAILLIVVVLLQQRGAGLGEAFGGSSNTFSSRRGAEKSLYQITIALAVIFVGLALFSLYQKSQSNIPNIAPVVENAEQVEQTTETVNEKETTNQ